MRRQGEWRAVVARAAILVLAVPIAAQPPTVFNVSDVVVGANRIPTKYFLAEGKWSDAGDNATALSTEIHCYKTLGICEHAFAVSVFGQSSVELDEFDILRWDDKEIIAVDSSPICVVNTLRADLRGKSVTMSSTDKGAKSDPTCKGSFKSGTAVLLGVEPEKREKIEKAQPKK